MKSFKTVLLAFFMSFFIFGCSQAENELIAQNQFNQIEMENWCIGRYAFQVPKNATLNGGSDKYDSFKIESVLSSSMDAFNAEIKKIQQKYSEGKYYIKDQTQIETHGMQVSKIIWGRYKYVRDEGPVYVYSFVYDQSARILFKIKGTYSKKYEEESIESIKYLVKNISARNNNIIPKESGICIQNGFIKDNGQKFKYSNQTIGFGMKDMPSIFIGLETESTTEKLDNLIDRTTKGIKESSFGASVFIHLKTVRKGKKDQNLGGQLQGYEWIITVPMKGVNGIDAVWEHTGTGGNALDPLVQLELNTGYDQKTASIAQKEALFLYEKLLNTVRKF
jgi:hypothetical protein